MGKNLIDIFKYFDNKDFERANANREFTIEEMLSIMLHSEAIAVEERAEDFKVLAEHADAKTNAKIERCLESELEKLDIIKSTKADDTMFISYGNDITGKHINRYATFDEIMASGVDRETLFINTYNDPEHRSSSIANFYVKDGKVTNTFVVAEFDRDADARELRKTEVTLDCPFKPFDLIEVGGKHYVVAELTHDVAVNEREPFGWLNITLPVYKVDADGSIRVDVVHKVPWMISELRKLDGKYITIADMEQVEYIKEHLA